MSSCPCTSNKTYAECCQLVHENHASADTPEKLMRARYSAHVLKLADFVVQTYHSSCKAEQQRADIEASIQLNWQKLDVISAPTVRNSEQGYVEFKAYLEEQGQVQCMHERSRFVKENGLWYYIDGVFPGDKANTPGRNDPCFCGSGKKYKKCCG